MTQHKDISQELTGLESSLANKAPQNIYKVPNGYFEGLANQVLNRIKAMEAGSSQEELAFLSPMLNSISKETPYSIPVGYFELLQDNLLPLIHETNDTAKEELEAISPLLSGISKKMPYSVPQGYFENLSANKQSTEPAKTKVVSLTSRQWFRYAAAAIVVGIVMLGGLLLWNRKPVDPSKNPDEWVAKNIKKVNTDQLDDFIKLADQESTTKASFANTNKSEKPDEIKELMKDVPDNQIQELLNETSALDESGENNSLN